MDSSELLEQIRHNTAMQELHLRRIAFWVRFMGVYLLIGLGIGALFIGDALTSA